jgi:AMMECR1 domain-containing protein
MHKLVELARKSAETFIKTRQEIPPPQELTPEMTAKAGVFVCIKEPGDA